MKKKQFPDSKTGGLELKILIVTIWRSTRTLLGMRIRMITITNTNNSNSNSNNKNKTKNTDRMRIIINVL